MAVGGSYRPRTLGVLASAVQAIETRPLPHRARAVGSGWSFSTILVPAMDSEETAFPRPDDPAATEPYARAT